VAGILSGQSRQTSTEVHCLPQPQIVLPIIEAARTCFRSEPALLELQGRFVVVGDLHGNLDCLLRIFGRIGFPPDASYLFLGDYVDRGKESVEVLLLLFALKVLYPNNVYLLRGNHECRHLTNQYGFREECIEKYDEMIYSAFCKVFNWLSIASIVNSAFICLHGGTSEDVESFNDLNEITKPIRHICLADDIVSEILWSDPSAKVEYYGDSKRNCGRLFGEAALDEWLCILQCRAMIRAHQFCSEGVFQPFGSDKCFTVFSSANYCGRGNSAAVLIIEDEIKPIEIFKPITEENAHMGRVIFPLWLLTDDMQTPSQNCPLLDEFVESACNRLIIERV
jgi:protein phosphatase